MKILNVIENIDETTGGGAAERTRQLCFHLSKLGHSVSLLTTKYNLSPSNINSLGRIKIIAIPLIVKRFFVPLPFLFRINNSVKQADIVHLVSHWTLINALVYIFLKIHKKPYVVSPLGALPIFGRSNLIKKLYNFIVGVDIIRGANVCVVPTLEEISALASYGVDKSSVVHIPNGINKNDYSTKFDSNVLEGFGIKDKCPFILFIGRHNLIKGPDLLMEAFCNVKDVYPKIHLVFIGPDEGMLDLLKKTASKYSVIDRTHFLGWVSREQKSALLQASMFLAIPSRQEAMSIVVLESGIVGKPVLISDMCGFNEVEKIGGGIVVPANVNGLVLGIKKMLGAKSNLSLMGLNLKKLVKNNYLWTSVASQYSSIFNKVIKEKL